MRRISRSPLAENDFPLPLLALGAALALALLAGLLSHPAYALALAGAPEARARATAEHLLASMRPDGAFAEWRGAALGPPTSTFAENGALNAYVFGVLSEGVQDGYVTVRALPSGACTVGEFSHASPPVGSAVSSLGFALASGAQVRRHYDFPLRYAEELVFPDGSEVALPRAVASERRPAAADARSAGRATSAALGSSYRLIADVPDWDQFEYDYTSAEYNANTVPPSSAYNSEGHGSYPILDTGPYYSGCVPTAAGDLVAYWALHGYPALTPGTLPALNPEFDPDVGPPYTARAPRQKVVNDLHVYMRTFKADRSGGGATYIGDCAPGLTEYAQQMGYGFITSEKDFPAWGELTAQIDADQPVELLFNGLDVYGPTLAAEYGNHAITGVGYDYTPSDPASRYMIVHDNWQDNSSEIYVQYGGLGAMATYDYLAMVTFAPEPPASLPTTPTLTSSSHPVPEEWSATNWATFSWTATRAVGYAYALDQNPLGVPGTVPRGSAKSVTIFAGDGEHWFHLCGLDANGVPGPTVTYHVRCDTAAPSGPVAIAGAGAGPAYLTTTSVSVESTLSDAESGLSEMQIDAGGGYGAPQPYAGHAVAHIPDVDASVTVSARFTDAVGNARVASRSVVLDRQCPHTTCDAATEYADEAAISLAASDAVSGVAVTRYSLDGTAAAAYAGPVAVSSPGTHTLEYSSADRAGNVEPTATVQFHITTTPPTVTRIDGADRYQVAAAAAATAFPEWAGVAHVVVACGDDRAAADPLSAAGLAGVYGAPVLLVPSVLSAGKLPAATEGALAGIRSANGGRMSVHVVGGTGSVPPAVYARLRALSGTGGFIERIDGRNRYQLSVHIAEKVAKLVYVPGVLLAAGDRSAAFYDALAASPISYRTHRPLIVTPGATLDRDVDSSLHGVFLGKPITVVNSEAYLTRGVAMVAGAETTRLATSADRYRAACDIASFALSRGWLAPARVGVANRLPDALTGGSAFGKLGGPVLYTSASAVPGVTSGWVGAHKSAVRRVSVIGGIGSVWPGVLGQLGSALQ